MRKLLMATIGAVMVLGACAPQQAAMPTREQRALNAGLAAYKAGRMAEAERQFGIILAVKPNDPFANLNIGAVMAQTDRTNAAISHYKKAVASGEGVPVGSVLVVGKVTDVDSTVADVARRNIERLGV